jgi:metal-responsive CopG/Arc/MetJ family transcriptional regulator
MAKVNVSIPDELLDEIDELASAVDTSRSGFVQEASARYIAQIRAEAERRARSERIERAMSDMREIADEVADFDGVAAIRHDRERDGDDR